ncbi:MAG: transglycosylase SLT domain-containing protein [Nanobdellota archaeon]
MKWWQSVVAAGLLSIPLSAYAPTSPEKNHNHISSLSARINNTFSRYNHYFQSEKMFWKTAFLTDSTRTLAYTRDNVNIIDILETPITDSPEEEKEADERLLDSLHKAYGVPEGTLGIIYGRREKMRKGVENAFFHLDALLDTLENHNLPSYLAGVILIESGFKNDAESHAGAIGIAQFMEGTARDYGLVVNDSIDERLDVHKSFGAFARYMDDAFERFDDEILAVQAYNVGMYSRYFNGYVRGYLSAEETVKKMGFAPRHYTASILVANDILKNPTEFYPELTLLKGSQKLEDLPMQAIKYKAKKTFINSLTVPENCCYEQ